MTGMDERLAKVAETLAPDVCKRLCDMAGEPRLFIPGEVETVLRAALIASGAVRAALSPAPTEEAEPVTWYVGDADGTPQWPCSDGASAVAQVNTLNNRRPGSATLVKGDIGGPIEVVPLLGAAPSPAPHPFHNHGTAAECQAQCPGHGDPTALWHSSYIEQGG